MAREQSSHRHNRQPQRDNPDLVSPVQLKEWIRSLTWDRLIHALEIQQDENETQLLLEMINLQVPPPTPIHPRAIQHPIASIQQALWDGKHATEYERTRRERTHKPRLLKWVSTINNNNSNLPYSQPRDIFQGSRTNHSRSSKNFRNKGTKNSQVPPQYSVMARGFITRDGNRYAIPPVYEQQQADEVLLQKVCLCSTLQSESKTVYLRLASDIASTSDPATDLNSLMKLLHLTSRGNFLTQPQTPQSSSPSWFQPTERWFPLSMYITSRLEMALVQSFASHVKQSTKLGWQHSFSSSNTLQRLDAMTAGPQFLSSLVAQVLCEVCRRDQSTSIPHVRESLLRHFLVESQGKTRISGGLSSTSSAMDVIHSLCVCPLIQIGSATDKLRSVGRQVLQQQLARQVERELLLLQEEADVGMSPKMHQVSTRNNNKSNNNAKIKPQEPPTQNNRRQAKKKSKQRNGKKTLKITMEISSGGDSETQNQQNTAAKELPMVEESNELEQKSSDEETIYTRHTTTNGLDFPENPHICNRTRNRNIVLVLGLLDDIVNDVFDVVGLSPTSPTEDCGVWQTSTKQVGAKVVTTTTNQNLTYVLKPAQRKKLGQKPPSIEKPPKEGGEAKLMESSDLVKPDRISSGQRMEAASPWTTNGADRSMFTEPMNSASSAEFNFSGTSTTGGASRGAFDIFASPYGNLAGGFFLRPESIGFAWDTHDFAFDQWSAAGHIYAREQSIMNDLFMSQERREQEIASSTIASIASSGPDDNVTMSNGGDDLYIIGNDDLNSEEPEFPDVLIEDDHEQDFGGTGPQVQETLESVSPGATKVDDSRSLESSFGSLSAIQADKIPDGFDAVAEEQVKELSASSFDEGKPAGDDVRSTSLSSKSGHAVSVGDNNERSPSPDAPNTPSPTLSPILVSLADLQVKKSGSPGEQLAVLNSETRSAASVPEAGGEESVSASHANVHTLPKPRMVSSLSRENLRSSSSNEERSRELSEASRTLKQQRSFVKYSRPKARDDNDIKHRGSSRRRSDALESYRTVASRSLVQSQDDDRIVKPTPRLSLTRAAALNVGGRTSSPAEAVSAQSEFDDYKQQWPDSRRNSNVAEDADNNTATRDGSTTITSALSHREGNENLREERDTYRDLCLTLGAEVAKLRNMLASQNQNIMMAPTQTYDYASSSPHQVHHHLHAVRTASSKYFDHPASLSHLVNSARSRTLAAMSDAGYRGEYESMASMASEDDYTGGVGKVSQHQRQTSSAATASSDVSIEHSAQQQLNFTVGVPLNAQSNNSGMPVSGVQSRLSVDIAHFVDVIGGQLRKQEGKRAKSVERMTRLVTALWPRAQVKLYGSHVTGLCLPTSDVDFIICLPAVQKDAPAVAPGVLEGRNAINESSQKMLARKLKNESWIDPRSMKLIERTVVPVIKVATKDTKARTLRLDITFDSPNHHGLEAVELVNRLLEEYPMIRPLVLVLKQFLLDRGLLTGYTGGLSSYCLFLMTARYLQEQATAWADCGALLMGFLDFYGNHVSFHFSGI